MRNKKLIIARKSTGCSQRSFAKLAGISVNTYKTYELMGQKPRFEKASVILNALNKLGVKCDINIFYPEINMDKNGGSSNKSFEKKLCEQMNIDIPNKKYTINEISIIDKAIKNEHLDRKEKNIKLDLKSKTGRKIINARIAKMANDLLNASEFKYNKTKITEKDIVHFKCCRILVCRYEDTEKNS